MAVDIPPLIARAPFNNTHGTLFILVFFINHPQDASMVVKTIGLASLSFI
jgi:hypothetical protein